MGAVDISVNRLKRNWDKVLKGIEEEKQKLSLKKNCPENILMKDLNSSIDITTISLIPREFVKVEKFNYFSENLKFIRYSWGFKSQDDFGKLLNVKRGNINNLENEKIIPRLEILFKLEDLTGLTIRELYFKQLTKEDIPESPIHRGE